MRRMSHNSKFWLVLICTVMCIHSGASDEAMDNTLRISADDFRGSIDGGAVITGNVELTHGSMNLKADQMTLRVKDDIFEGVEAKGNPVLLQLSLSEGEEQRTVNAEAASVIYLASEDQIEFEGNAKVESEEVSITGNKIRLDIKENQIEAESLDADNQVEVILHNVDVGKKATDEQQS